MERRSDQPDAREKERLEFLADSVLGLVAAAFLYHSYPNGTEGALALVRAGLVSGATLSAWAAAWGLDDWLLQETQEDATPGGRNTQRLAARVFEAIIGAVYLEQGIVGAERLLLPFLESWTPRVIERGGSPKNQLQERVQAHGGTEPVYRVVSENGPPHARVFIVDVVVNGVQAGRGVGGSKRLAERAAAEQALLQLDGSPQQGKRKRQVVRVGAM